MTGIDAWIQGITTIGFPSVAYIMLFRLYSKTLKEQKKAFREQAQAFRSLRSEVKDE